MKFLSSFWAGMVSGTMGASLMRVVQSLGLRNISEEWMKPTTWSMSSLYTMILELPLSMKWLLRLSMSALMSMAAKARASSMGI